MILIPFLYYVHYYFLSSWWLNSSAIPVRSVIISHILGGFFLGIWFYWSSFHQSRTWYWCYAYLILVSFWRILVAWYLWFYPRLSFGCRHQSWRVWFLFLIKLAFDHCYHLSDFVQVLTLAAYGLFVCWLIGGGVSGPCMGVCRGVKYKFGMVLVDDSVYFTLEDFSSEAALSFDVVSKNCLCVS